MRDLSGEKNQLIPSENFPEGYWGIFHDPHNVPTSRFDSFRTTIDNFGTKIGHSAQISPMRVLRPVEIESKRWIQSTLNTDKTLSIDEFCRLVRGDLPAIVLVKDSVQFKDPDSVNPEKDNLRKYSAITIVNLYTPMGRQLLKNDQSLLKDISLGYPLIHLTTKHYTRLEDVPTEELVKLLQNTVISHKLIEKRHKASNLAPMPIFHFFNIGAHAGASIFHLHSQSYIYTNKKGHGWKVQGFLVAFEDHKRFSQDPLYCLGCEYPNYPKNDLFGQELHIEKRLIWKNKHWLLVAEYAPERDGHLRILPQRHISRLSACSEEELESLAKILKIANLGLSAFIEKWGEHYKVLQDRNILFRQQHLGYASTHMLIEIIPIQHVGGAEVFDDHRICHIYPEITAQFIRDAIQQHEKTTFKDVP
ncbi:MAG: HIT domain-containing protein [Promethearchaeota archaeon]